MEFVLGYSLFAATTAIVFLLEFYWPVLSNIKILKPQSPLVEHNIIGSLSMFGMGFLTAPILIIPCIIPKSGASFKRALEESLLKD